MDYDVFLSIVDDKKLDKILNKDHFALMYSFLLSNY